MRIAARLFILFFVSGCASSGAPWQGYRGPAILEARSRGSTYYLHFYREGDRVCEDQKTLLKAATSDRKYQKTFAYRIKWNEEPKLQSVLGVTGPCVLLSFKGEEERGRSTKTSNSAELIQVLERGL